MATVLENYSPISAASDAVGAYVQQKRQNQLDADAKAAAQQQAANAAAQLALNQRAQSLSEKTADRTYGLDTQRVGNETRTTDSNIQTADLERDAIAEANHHAAVMNPLLEKAQALQNKGSLTANEIAELTKLEKQIQVAGAKFELHLQLKYGEKTAQLALAQSQANLNQTTAQTGLTQAETYATMHPTLGARGSVAQQADTAFYQAIDSLSPAATAFVQRLFSSDNPPTRVQAMLALKAAVHGRGKDALTAADQKAITTIIDSKLSSFVTPGSQVSGARADRNFDARSAEERFHDVARGQSYNQLPPKLRDAVRHLLVDLKMSIPDATQTIQGASSFDDPSKQAMISSLNGQ